MRCSEGVRDADIIGEADVVVAADVMIAESLAGVQKDIMNALR
jgi:hypothetical protein